MSRTIVPGVKMLAIPTPVRVPGLSLEAVAGVMTGPDQDKVSRVPVQRRQPRLPPDYFVICTFKLCFNLTRYKV